ncbi:MAG: TonB-dependent receptor [Myxococcota bacterium]|nr:TonB-dependent receptor [Myxococcota bacterium]
MRCALIGLAIVTATTHARADDPRDLFGLGKDKKPAERESCDDAKTLGCTTARDDFDPVSPYAVRTWLPSSYLLKLPVGDTRIDSIAHYAAGTSRDEAGPVFGGASGLENRWTIEGAPADNLRTGNVDTRVPLTFTEGMLVQAGGFAARDRTSTGGTIDIQLRRGTAKHELEAHVWGGLAGNGTRRPVADSSFQLRRVFANAGPNTSASVVATGPLPGFQGGKAWYAAGIAPSLAFTEFDWTAKRLVDLDDDGNPDGFPGPIALESIEDTSERTLDYLVPLMARAGWERGPHAVDVTLIGHANRDTSMLANATEQAAGIDREGYVGDAIATWRGSWKRTHARAQLAWHRSVRNENAHDSAAQGEPQFLSAYVPRTLDEDPVLAAACYDRNPMDPMPGEPEDRYVNIPNCPIPFGFFASRGAGLITDTTGDRPSMTADITHARGKHMLRAGATLEDTRLVLRSRFTGGFSDRSLFDGHIDRQRFYAGECSSFTILENETFCNYQPEQTLRYRTRYTAAYVEDTYEITPRIRANAGVRWELMWVGTDLHFSREWAPRLGLAWELLDGTHPKCPDCTARWWASMGRSFVMLPAGLGPTVIRRNATARDVEFGLGPSRAVNPGNVFTIADGIAPAAQDEVTTGIELGVPKILRFAGWVQGRTLRRGYETVTYPSGASAFDNPGRQGDEPATRDSVVLALEAMIAPTPKMTFRASYLYGRTVGSWAGPFDPRQGANLYNGEDWDSVTGNIVGRLPTDAGHRALFELERRGRVGKLELAAAARLTTQSGRPRSVLADGDTGIIYLLQRGTEGRGELLSQANVRLAARWQRTDITLDIFNLFDHRTPTTRDEVYTAGDIRPISGGTQEDLVWARTETGSPIRRRTGYGLPLTYQSPIAVTLGLHQAF